MNRHRRVLAVIPGTLLLAALLIAAAQRPQAVPPPAQVSKIAFGSCAHQDKPQPIWDVIREAKPDVFAFLGDTVYGDTVDMEVLKSKYDRMARLQPFAAFRAQTPVIGTWDDHEYGMNDAGVEYPKKHETKQIFLDFFEEPANSPRRNRDGVYQSYVYGEPGHRVQILLLDTRWFRSPLNRGPNGYLPDPSPEATILGAEQWAWLEAQLDVPADIRVIGSSIQVISDEHVYEKWANFPLERQRLLDLLTRKDVTASTVLISGDRHHAEIDCMNRPDGRLCEVTASGINMAGGRVVNEPNSYRLGLYDRGNHFGMLVIEWPNQPKDLNGAPGVARVALEIRDARGETMLSQPIGVPLSSAH